MKQIKADSHFQEASLNKKGSTYQIRLALWDFMTSRGFFYHHLEYLSGITQRILNLHCTIHIVPRDNWDYEKLYESQNIVNFLSKYRVGIGIMPNYINLVPLLISFTFYLLFIAMDECKALVLTLNPLSWAEDGSSFLLAYNKKSNVGYNHELYNCHTFLLKKSGLHH